MNDSIELKKERLKEISYLAQMAALEGVPLDKGLAAEAKVLKREISDAEAN